MPFSKYSLYNIAGGVAWIVFFLSLGYFCGNIPWVKTHFTVVVFIIVALSLSPVMYELMKQERKR